MTGARKTGFRELRTSHGRRGLLRTAVAVLLGTAVVLPSMAFVDDLPHRSPAVAAVKDSGVDSPEAAIAEIPPDLYLGLFTAPLPPAVANAHQDTVPAGKGLLVTHVLPGSPAAVAGIQPRDVLLEFAGQSLATVGDLRTLVARSEPARRETVVLLRGGVRESLPITPAIRPATQEGRHAYRLVPNEKSGRNERQGEGLAAGTIIVVSSGNKAALPIEKSDPAADTSILVTTADGASFMLTASRRNESGTPSERTARGSLDEIRRQIESWPAADQSDAESALTAADAVGKIGKADALREKANALPPIRCRLAPTSRPGGRGVRLTLETPAGQFPWRHFQLHHALQPGESDRSERLLRIPALKDELNAHTPAVRNTVEAALQRVTLPQLKVDVQNAQ